MFHIWNIWSLLFEIELLPSFERIVSAVPVSNVFVSVRCFWLYGPQLLFGEHVNSNFVPSVLIKTFNLSYCETQVCLWSLCESTWHVSWLVYMCFEALELIIFLLSFSLSVAFWVSVTLCMWLCTPMCMSECVYEFVFFNAKMIRSQWWRWSRFMDPQSRPGIDPFWKGLPVSLSLSFTYIYKPVWSGRSRKWNPLLSIVSQF